LEELKSIGEKIFEETENNETETSLNDSNNIEESIKIEIPKKIQIKEVGNIIFNI
jgi:hypothetical protein